jgi:sugar transferase (PEP-CTERM/EpsH1 system associated)
MLRILWLSHLVPYPPAGGAPQRSYHLLRQAASRHEVHLLALNQSVLLPSPKHVEAAIHHLGGWCAGVSVHPIPWDRWRPGRVARAAQALFSTEPYAVRWLRSTEVRRRLRVWLRAQPFDVIHVDTLGLAPYTNDTGGTPIVLTHHDVESHLAARLAERDTHRLRRCYRRLDAAKLARFERRVCRSVAMNLAVSVLDAERLAAVAGPVRTVVVENGVDVEYFRPAEGRGDGLVFAGSLDTYPNRDAVAHFLKDIWPLLLAERPQRRVTLVGRSPAPEALAAARDPRVRVTGRVDDVRPYVAGAAIYVCPIRVGGGTRLKVLDALAMGKPVVATATAVEGLELRAGEHYLRAETPPEFVAAIGRLEEDAELGRRLAAAGRDLAVRRYSWDVIGRRLDEAYRTAVSVPR